jgi:signal transduction histidine kinase
MNLHKDGRTVVLETSGVPVFDHEGRWTGYRGIDRDITDRKHGERALEELNRTLQQRVEAEVAKNLEKDRMLMVQARQAAMGEMLGNIAHQWRQPLNAIGLIIQDVQDAQANSVLTPAYLDRAVERAMEVIGHMSQTIDDFRILYRTEKKRQAFCLTATIERVLALVQAGFDHHHIAVDADLGPPVNVDGYPNELSQVLLNLLINARDVLVERAVPSPRVTVRLDRAGGRVAVTIADNGGGIPDDIRDRIFDPYFTTKEEGKGTGIGLYLSKTIIEKNMGGTLSARNTGDGAEFRITL